MIHTLREWQASHRRRGLPDGKSVRTRATRQNEIKLLETVAVDSVCCYLHCITKPDVTSLQNTWEQFNFLPREFACRPTAIKQNWSLNTVAVASFILCYLILSRVWVGPYERHALSLSWRGLVNPLPSAVVPPPPPPPADCRPDPSRRDPAERLPPPTDDVDAGRDLWACPPSSGTACGERGLAADFESVRCGFDDPAPASASANWGDVCRLTAATNSALYWKQLVGLS